MTAFSGGFLVPMEEGLSPSCWYERMKTQQGFVVDEAQARGVAVLDRLWHELVDFKKQRGKWLGKTLRQPEVPKGVFLWGGVGRGKSFLMDAFFLTLPYRRKRRVHFHAFMSEIHQRLNTLKHKENPLEAVATAIALETRVLCFDEFHVSDIADAMILGGLLKGLFGRGVVLVATSNYPPDGLYPNGLKRDNFMPAIRLLTDNLVVEQIEGTVDYRHRSLMDAGVFFVPNNEANRQKMQSLYQKMTGTLPESATVILLGREIAVVGVHEQVIWFDFEVLCCSPRSYEDYLLLAQAYRTVFLSDIRSLSAQQSNEARRLTWLIDVFYDYRVKLVTSSAVAVDEIFTQGDFAQEFARTGSRLLEMHSEEYLALPHLTLR